MRCGRSFPGLGYSQPAFFFIHRLYITSIREQKNPIPEGAIELGQCK
jgi:hypothetical protein